MNEGCILYPVCDCQYKRKWARFYSPQHEVIEEFTMPNNRVCIVGGGGSGDTRMGEKIVEGNLIPARCFQSGHGPECRIYERLKDGSVCVVDYCNTRKRLVNVNIPYFQLYRCIQRQDGTNRFWNYNTVNVTPKTVKKRVCVGNSCNGSDVIGVKKCFLRNAGQGCDKPTRFDQYRLNANNKCQPKKCNKKRPDGFRYY